MRRKTRTREEVERELKEIELEEEKEKVQKAKEDAERKQKEKEEKKRKKKEKKVVLKKKKTKQKERVDLLKKKESWFSIKSLKQKYKRNFKSTKIIIANFELMNGHHDTILAVVDENGLFHYRDKDYIVDDDLKYWHFGFKDYCLDYHEGFSLPIKRKFPINEIKEAMHSSRIENVVYATNPSTLRNFLTSHVIQSAVEGGELTAFFKQLRLLMLIVVVASVIHLVLYMQKNGMFSGFGI